MSNPIEYPLRRILEIADAIAVIADNKYLDGTTSYRVGRLGDQCKSAARMYQKAQSTIIKRAKEEEKALSESVKSASNEEKLRVQRQINELVDKANEESNEMQDELKETLRIPKLNLSDFIAKKDITELVTKDGNTEAKVAVREGQALVPVKFFVLMGELINDDKNVFE